MAAYASVVSLAQTIQHFLQDDHPFPSNSLFGEHHNIESLQEHVNLLQAFLDEFPDKATTDLEVRIRDASNVAEDLIEYLMLGSRDLHKLSSKLRKAAQRISSIVGEVTDIKNNTTGVKFGDSSSRLPPSSTGEEDIMVGFDEDLLAIKTQLCGNSPRLEIIPISGMGGIGKTTLARNAYEDPSTIHRFHIRAWVTVSQDYKAEEVLSRLQDGTKAFFQGQSGESDETVYKSLKGRRYLIVLDDMWSTEVWDDVKRIFPNDNNGSRIMLTTRLADVAAYVNSSSHLHQMRLRDANWSWQLLQRKVFKKEHCPPQLEKIGRTIAGSCKGLPLAIVVVAGILSTTIPTEASWENVASKVTSTFTANDNEITQIFSLSYTHLPHHLRPCFLYMGGFPEDHDIHASKLVKLWTAEGFMKPSGGSKSFEEVGEVYLEDLVKRSLVFVTRRKPNGKIKSCSIHDLLRELCIRKAKEEKFLLCDDKFISDGLSHTSSRRNLNQFCPFISYRRSHTSRRNLNQCRRVSMGELDIPYVSLLPLCGPTVRSILFYGNQQLSRLEKLKLLRVLDATKMDFAVFSDHVHNLSLLRYLAFHVEWYFLEIRNVLPSISKLRNLQTLVIFLGKKFRYYPRDNFFPLEFWSMRRLRHFHIVGKKVAVRLCEPCSTAFPLQDLQTLATVTDFRCTEGVLQMIPNLKKLGIVYDCDESGETNWEEYHLDNLIHLGHLEELSIQAMLGDPKRVVKCLRFPVTLKKLKLHGFVLLSQQDMEIIGSMPNLEMLKLYRCEFEDGTWETTEGEFPKLKVLTMAYTKLKKWTIESSCFPSLKHLHLSCHDLREIPEEIGEIPTLELIEVEGWNKSVVESAERMEAELREIYGEDSKLQVHIIPY